MLLNPGLREFLKLCQAARAATASAANAPMKDQLRRSGDVIRNLCALFSRGTVPGLQPLPSRLDPVLEKLIARVGMDEALRSRLIRRDRSPRGWVPAPLLHQDGSLWAHRDGRGAPCQFSTARGLLFTERHLRNYLYDLGGMWARGRHPEILFLTFSQLTAALLRAQDMRAAAVLSARQWDAELNERLDDALAIEEVRRVVVWVPGAAARPRLPEGALDWLVAAAERWRSAGSWSLEALVPDALGAGDPIGLPMLFAPDAAAKLDNALERLPSYTDWVKGLPAPFRRPSGWADLLMARLSEMNSAGQAGKHFRVGALILKRGPLVNDPGTARVRCSWARRPASTCRGEPDPDSNNCRLVVPASHRLDLKGPAAARRKAIKAALRRHRPCLVNRSGFRVLRFTEVRPHRQIEIMEAGLTNEVHREKVFVDSDAQIGLMKNYEMEVFWEASVHSGNHHCVAHRLCEALMPAEKLLPNEQELAVLQSNFGIDRSASRERVEQILRLQMALWQSLVSITTVVHFEMVRLFWLLYLAPHSLLTGTDIERGGAASVFVLGDPTIGKTFLSEKILNLLKLGHYSDASSRSRTGLLGGRSGRGFEPGEIPLQDRQLQVVDEVHSLDRKIWQELRSVRREGAYVYVRMNRATFPTRTRLLCIANPKAREFGPDPAHPYGAATEYLQPADVARFDAFFHLRRGSPRCQQDDAPLAPELGVRSLQGLVALAWVKAYEEKETWDLPPDTISAVNSAAEALKNEFGRPDFPLLSGDKVPSTVLVWATAFSNLAPVAWDQQVHVLPVHVECAAAFLQRMAEDAGLAAQGQATASPQGQHQAPSATSTGAESARKLREILADPLKERFARCFRAQDSWRCEDLASALKKNVETLRKGVLRWFVKEGLVKSRPGRGGGLWATEEFRSLLADLGVQP